MAEGIQEITGTLRALVKAMSEVHSGNKAEAYQIAREIFVAIRDGKVPLIKLEDDDNG
jgi:hypothetical protein